MAEIAETGKVVCRNVWRDQDGRKRVQLHFMVPAMKGCYFPSTALS